MSLGTHRSNPAVAMSSSFEKSVKGGTKVKLAPPKSKYVEHILLATQSGEAGVAEVFRTLQNRLRDATWTVAFKALIIVHLLIKEGVQDVTLRYLAVAPRNRLAINTFTDVQTQGHNIRLYSEYLLARAQAYERSKCDHVRAGEGRMKRLTVETGLLRQTEIVQDQVRALVKCDLLSNDVENEISLTAFRLLTRDLLDLYNVENEAVMNVLSHYFEMSRPDAERSITIYKTFCKQTEQVVQYLSVARQYEHATRLEIPKLKHAPTSLAASLQEYLNDQDFEMNRRRYLAERNGTKPSTNAALSKSGLQASKPAPASAKSTPFDNMAPTTTLAAPSEASKGPASDLIDFFGSIEQNQETMQTNPFLQQKAQQSLLQPQMTGYQYPPVSVGYQQESQPAINGYGTSLYGQQESQPPQQQLQPLETQFTGAGFGGYGPQPEHQQIFNTGSQYLQSPAPVQSQTTNPFRQSMMAAGPSLGAGTLPQQGLARHSTNPFAKSAFAPIPENVPSTQQQQQQQQHYQTSPFGAPTQYQPQVPQATGTNPFVRRTAAPEQASPGPPNALQVQPTGSTNPFRQSQFVNQQSGVGWQHGPQGTLMGLESLETVPVFPRPSGGGGQFSQPQQSPWAV